MWQSQSHLVNVVTRDFYFCSLVGRLALKALSTNPCEVRDMTKSLAKASLSAASHPALFSGC
jgi:hypothetical protein